MEKDECGRRIKFEHYSEAHGWQYREYCSHTENQHGLDGCRIILSQQEFEDNRGRWRNAPNVCPCSGYVEAEKNVHVR